MSEITQSTPTGLGPRRRGALIRAIFRRPMGAVALTWLLLLVLAAIFAPLLTPYAYDIQALKEAYQPPSATHLLGTDEFGRDLLTRLLYGARTSLSVSSIAISISVFCGMLLGAAAGYFGGRFDRLVTTVVDLSWSFPEILIALILVAIIGPGVTGTMAAIAVAYLAQFARLTRSQIMTLKGETFIEAARSLGAGHAFILFRHLIPNALAPVLVSAMLATGDAIILEATLGFFGLGAQPPVPSWGSMMSSGSALLFKAPWIIIFPGLAVATTVVMINLFGDALIAALDIKSQVRRSE
jgi:peptide/nickel transport system permease protein